MNEIFLEMNNVEKVLETFGNFSNVTDGLENQDHVLYIAHDNTSIYR